MRKGKGVLFKDTLRTIWRSKGRFLSILIIVAIGTAFYAGISSTCPDMKDTAQKYFEDKNLMDLRIKSTMGFDEKDIKAIKEKEGVIDVESGYSKDLFVKTEGRQKLIVSTYSYNAYKNINKLTLKEGRLPLADDECVVEQNANTPDNFKVGKILEFTADDGENLADHIKYDKYKVVGIVESPMYISNERGSSKLGDGNITAYVYFSEDTYVYEHYSDLYVTYENTHNISPFGGHYQSLIDENKQHMEEVKNQRIEERYLEMVGFVMDDVKAAQDELNSMQAKKEAEFKKTKKQLKEDREDLEDREEDYKKDLKKYRRSRNEITSEEKLLEQQTEEYDKSLKEYGKDLVEFNNRKAEETAKNNATEATLKSIEGVINGTTTKEKDIEKVVKDTKQLENYGGTLSVLLNNYVAGDSTAASNITQIIASIREGIDADNAKLVEEEEALAKIKKGLDKRNKEYKEREKELEEKKAEFKKKNGKKKKKLDKEGKAIEKEDKRITKAEKQLEKDKALLKTEVKIRQKEIDENLEAINKLEKPVWTTYDRTSNPGYTSYEADANRVAKIALFFPLFFILLAILVCLTTMTRMIDEQMIEIGTLKALGYSNATIVGKYIIYAGSASILGSIIGVTLGCKLFPAVIFNAYKMAYCMPNILSNIRLEYMLGCMAISLICIIITTLLSCRRDLSATPSELMRPKAPSRGKRIFLEGIASLWEEIGFMKKVAFRNLSIYKKRMILTILAIGGCMALMFAGFGLRHSIGTIVDKQFNDIFKYHFTATMNADITEENTKQLYTSLSKSEYVSRRNLAYKKAIYVSKDNVRKEANIFVMKYSNRLGDYITLRERISREKLTLNERGVIINEKLASLLGVREGDTIKIEDTDVEVRGITENYTDNYIYMTPKIYKTIYGQDVKYNMFIGYMIDRSKKAELTNELVVNPDIQDITFTDEMGDDFADVVGRLDFIVVVMVIFAALLAFAVLYNLSVINMNERTRELATIKVLGFYDDEVSKYIYRENAFTTIVGIIVGVLMGIPLAYYITKTVEVDTVMFNPSPGVGAYIWSIVLTVLFTIIVNFILHYKLKKIDITNSLKSFE